MLSGNMTDSMDPSAALSSVAGGGRGSEVADLARSPLQWVSSLFPMPPSNPPY